MTLYDTPVFNKVVERHMIKLTDKSQNGGTFGQLREHFTIGIRLIAEWIYDDNQLACRENDHFNISFNTVMIDEKFSFSMFDDSKKKEIVFMEGIEVIGKIPYKGNSGDFVKTWHTRNALDEMDTFINDFRIDKYIHIKGGE
jgi:hypothetical protein